MMNNHDIRRIRSIPINPPPLETLDGRIVSNGKPQKIIRKKKKKKKKIKKV